MQKKSGRTAMKAEDIFALGLGLGAPWGLISQRLDMNTSPFELYLEVGAERGAKYPCPTCGAMCSAHDFEEMTWRHLNFFQHYCYIIARVPRVKCQEHGIHRTIVPWSRPGSGFTLLFEQIVMSLAKEMPVNAVARIVGVTDNRIWRIIRHYVYKAMTGLDLSNVCGVGLDETASKRGHNYVTVFLDMDRLTKPVIFAVPGKGKETLKAFAAFLKNHKGKVDNIIEVVCDMSPAFIAAVYDEFPIAALTVDWFHVVQLFTKGMDDVRKLEARKVTLPEGSRWTTLKGIETKRTDTQEAALKELVERGLATATAFRVKEMLRWVREADTKQGARWRATNFLQKARELVAEDVLLAPMRKVLNTFEEHLPRIIRRWESLLSNARLESMNGLFQAARAKARGYRNVEYFITMIYLIGSPITDLLDKAIPH
jgi:transposase